ncbi:MAG TPA: hypothetical protein VKA68_12685, partial [bacterium]|nr:hypothetical protein [bacterium]
MNFLQRLYSFYVLFLTALLLGCTPTDSNHWVSMQRNYRIPIEVQTEPHSGYAKPVEVPVNLTRSLSDVNIEGTVDPTSVYLVETDSLGAVIDEQVPAQFDPADGFTAYDNAAGTLLFLLKHQLSKSETRYYHLYFGEQGKMYDAPAVTPLIRISSDVEFRGQQSIALRNQLATYFYHKMGAGFAGLIDTAGHDWISYQPGGGSAGEYRGIPNLVHPEGHFHPGSETSSSVI